MMALDGWRWRDERMRELVAWAVYTVAVLPRMQQVPNLDEFIAELLGSEAAERRIRTRLQQEKP